VRSRAEVARLAAERALHAVGEVGVAPVQDLAEEVREQLDELAGQVLIRGSREVVDRDRHVADFPAGRLGDLAHRFGERQEPRPGQLVEPPDVAVVCQRRDGDVGDVVRVDERLGHVAGGQRHLAAPDPLDDVVLAEVLGEPCGAHDRQLHYRAAR
jgi:hypothetical protein